MIARKVMNFWNSRIWLPQVHKEKDWAFLLSSLIGATDSAQALKSYFMMSAGSNPARDKNSF